MDQTPSTTQLLREKAHRLIPGGAHTYAKGDDQYPSNAPGFIVRGDGCYVWDTDGRRYIEYGMGLRAVTLGHAYPPVVEAVTREMSKGSNFTRPSPIETDCAEMFLDATGAGDMVKFTKDGSTANTAAVRLARAYTGRDMIAICAEDPFLSYDDWFIGTTPMRGGIPAWAYRDVVKFQYNDAGSLRRLFDQFPKKIACVIFEFERATPPKPGFLQSVRMMCEQEGAVLIADENICGFRYHIGGAQGKWGVKADLSTFGKAIANGFALSALAGKRDIMEAGGLGHDKERVFLLSTTHGGETHAMAAAIATMRAYRKFGIISMLEEHGDRLARGIHQVTETNQMLAFFNVVGPPCNLVFVTRDHLTKPSQPFRTLFMQEMVRNGVLGPSFVISAAHTVPVVDRTIDAVDKALKVYRKAIENESVEGLLEGPSVKSVFRERC